MKDSRGKSIAEEVLSKSLYLLEGNYINFYSTNLFPSLFSIFEKYEPEYSMT